MEWITVEFQKLYTEPSRNGLYKSKEFHGTGIRIVNMKELFAFPCIGDQEMQLLKVNDSELNKFGLKTGDLLFARRSLVEEGSGKCVLIVQHKSPIVFESSIIRVRLNKNVSLPLFYYYYFRSPTGRLGIQSIITGAGQKGIRGSELATIQVVLPPLPEQKAIALTLSETDALIAECDRAITKKRHIKQGAMQQLLTGKVRLPSFSGEWEMKKLGDYVDIASGESPSKLKFLDSGIPYFKVEQLNNSNKYQKESTYYVKYNNPIQQGSIIFPKRGASILLNKIRILSFDSFMDTNLMTLTTKENLNNEFLFYILLFYELWRIADTTSIPQINNKHINPFMIPL